MKRLVLVPVFAPIFALLFALVLWAGVGSSSVRAAEKNKCGCYKDGAGTCFCDKKAKCGCPGDCEPKGCEQAREKQIQKEIEAETKKAAEADRKHTAVSTKSAGGSKAAASEKKSADDGADEGARSAKESKESSKSGGAEPAAGRKLTPAQAKQLVKLLDAYFAENPDARSRNVEEVRNQLSQSR
jgi:hypothetical protein